MLAHMPSMEFYHSFFPEPGDLCWSPADWAWIGGLMDNLMPAWFAGDAQMAACADVCDRCAQSCQKMAQSTHAAHG